MEREQFREYNQRFRRWQQAVPHYANRHEGTVQHCHNCGNDFDGNFCPICGQRAEVGRVGWNSIRENIAILWGLDSRSLTYTLVQRGVRAIWCATTSAAIVRCRFRLSRCWSSSASS